MTSISTYMFPDPIYLVDDGMIGESRIFKLTQSVRVRTLDKGPITIPADFPTDGASIPKLFWSILYPFGPYFPAALLHDFLYSRESNKFYHKIRRADADKLFLEAMEAVGVDFLTRQTIYIAVRAFGKTCYKKD
jgi:hypothetical protein